MDSEKMLPEPECKSPQHSTREEAMIRFQHVAQRTMLAIRRMIVLMTKGEEWVGLALGLLFLLALVLSAESSMAALLARHFYANFWDLLTFVLNCFAMVFAILFLLHYVLLKIADPLLPMSGIIKRDWRAISHKLDQIDGSQIRDLKEEELETLAALGHGAFGSIATIPLKDRLNMYRRWFSRNQRVFSFISTKDGDIAGYICVLPLVHEAASLHLRGALSQFSIGEKDIREGRSAYIYIQAFYLKPEYQRKTEFILILSRALVDKISSLIPHTGRQPLLYAEAFSGEGAKILEHVGFTLRPNKSLNGHCIYELDFRRSEDVSSDAWETVELIRNYKGEPPDDSI